MRTLRVVLFLMFVAGMLCPPAAFAKRAAPKPVSPVVYGGVEYRASVWDMGFVEAVDVASHKKLWRTRVYYVWYMPLAEKDVQDIFVTSLTVQDGNLLVRNESGRSYRVDLRSGHVQGAARYWLPWMWIGIGLLSAGFLVWRRFKSGQPSRSSETAASSGCLPSLTLIVRLVANRNPVGMT
jgi:hypothetical protein